VAGGAKVSALAGEGQKELMVAVSTFHTGNSIAQVAAVQVLVDDLPEIGTEESIGPHKSIFITLDEGFQMILDAAIIIVCLQISGPIYGGLAAFTPLVAAIRSC
jgi:hypothetical protein